MKRILLIPGHTAKDNFAKTTGVYEGELNIEIVKNIATHLTGYAAVTIYPIERDYYKDLKAHRISEAYHFRNYDYVWEQHLNEFDGSARGASCQIHKNYRGGISVEKLICCNLEKLGFRLRGTNGIVRRADLLNMNTALALGVDYCLCEPFFCDNPKDLALYRKDPDALAKAIADGMIDGFGLKKNAGSAIGTVAHCSRLNVREKPNGKVAFVISAGDTVIRKGSAFDSEGDSWDLVETSHGTGYVWPKYIHYN